MKVTESILLKTGFTQMKLTKTSKDIIKNKLLILNIKTLDILDYYKIEYFKYSKDLFGEILCFIKVYKLKGFNGKHLWVYEDSDGYIGRIVNYDEFLVEYHPHLNYNEKLGFVYIIESNLGYKIGHTKNIEKRTNIFNVKIPFEWEYQYIFMLDDYKKLEKKLHHIFKQKRIKGEWFNLTIDDIKSIIQIIESSNNILKIEKKIDYIIEVVETEVCLIYNIKIDSEFKYDKPKYDKPKKRVCEILNYIYKYEKNPTKVFEILKNIKNTKQGWTQFKQQVRNQKILTDSSNVSMEKNLISDVYATFNVGTFYTPTQINEILNELIKKHNLGLESNIKNMSVTATTQLFKTYFGVTMTKAYFEIDGKKVRKDVIKIVDINPCGLNINVDAHTNRFSY